jgi:hypothetical protein
MTDRLHDHLLLVKSRRHQAVRFLFVHLGDVARGDSLVAGGAEKRSVVLRKVYASFDDSVVVHFYKIAFADFLIVGDKAFAVGAAHFENVTTPDLFTIWIFV